MKISAILLHFPEGKRTASGVIVSPHVAVHQAPDVERSSWYVSDPVSGRKYPVVPFKTRKAALAWARLLVGRFGPNPIEGGDLADDKSEPAKWLKRPTRFKELKAFIHDTNFGAAE